MSDNHIDRVAEVIYVEAFGLPDYSPDAVEDHNRHSFRGDCECNASDRDAARRVAEDLDAAGLLASPERDREIAAKALRDAADALEMKLGVEGTPRDLWEFRQWMRMRADRIEAGEDDE